MTKKGRLHSTLAFAVLLLGGAAFAIEPNMPATGPTGSGPSEAGFELGVRSGYAVPLGKAGDAASFSEIIKGMVPLWLDVGYRIDPNWYFGGFFQYGFGFVPSNAQACNITGVSCSTSDMRFGANVHYHFLPDQTMDPWAGIGTGYEITKLSASAPGASASATTSGFEFVNAQLGLDLKVSPAFAVGPFVTFTVAQFSSRSASLNGQDLPIGDYTNKAIHMWLIFGLRGTFDVFLD